MKHRISLRWLMEKQKGTFRQILACIGLFLFFYLLLGDFGITLALVIGMFLHEFGHYFVFVKNGILTNILAIFPLGAMAVPINDDYEKRSNMLPWWNISTLLQAGYTMNLVLMIVGVVMVLLGILPTFGHQLIEINGALALFNLLPVWILDGGQLFKVIFASQSLKHDRVLFAVCVLVCVVCLLIVLAPAAILGMMPFLAAVWRNISLVLFLVIFPIGLATKLRGDRQELSNSTQAMTQKQIVIQIGWYLAITILTLVLLNLPI